MRILLIHQYFNPRRDAGANRWNRMTRVWVEQGHEATVIAGMYDGGRNETYPWCKGKLFYVEKDQEGIEVIRTYTTEKYNKNFCWRAWAYFTYIIFGFWAAMFYAKGKYDLVLASSPPLHVGPLGVAVSLFKRIPFVFEVRDLWPESAIDAGVVTNPFLIKFMCWMEKISYKRAAAINALTPAFVKKLVADKGMAQEKVWMIPNAADLDMIQPGPIDRALREKHGWGDKFVALYAGAHGKANHLWQLIDAAKLLKDDPDFMIVCVGSGMERDALIQKVEQEKLTNIQFLRHIPRDELSRYLHSCDAMVIVLKKVDTFKTVYPNKMFESMAAAKPVILAIDGVARQLVVEDAQCGVFAEPENAQEIVGKMRFYRDHPQIARRHGRNGYRYVCEHYDRHKLARKYLQMIQEKIVNQNFA